MWQIIYVLSLVNIVYYNPKAFMLHTHIHTHTHSFQYKSQFFTSHFEWCNLGGARRWDSKDILSNTEVLALMDSLYISNIKVPYSTGRIHNEHSLTGITELVGQWLLVFIPCDIGWRVGVGGRTWKGCWLARNCIFCCWISSESIINVWKM